MKKTSTRQTVVVLGASDKPHRYSYRAVKLLKQFGHRVIPVHPVLDTIDGITVISELSHISEKIDTLTLYIGPERSPFLVDDIIALQPKRIIFNPGTESDVLEQKLSQAEIACIHDCTLIMLETSQFDSPV